MSPYVGFPTRSYTAWIAPLGNALELATGGDKQWFTIDKTNSTGHGFQYQFWTSGASNYGVQVNGFTSITAGGGGSVSVQGTGGAAHSTA